MEERHLGIELIECLIEGSSGVDRNDAQPGRLEEARRHLETCKECQLLVAVQKEGDRILRGVKGQFPPSALSSCPPSTKLYELSAGLLPEEASEVLIEHALDCRKCGAILRQTIKELSSEHTAEEDATIATLTTGTPAWQQAMGRTLAAAARIETAQNSKVVSQNTALRRFWRSRWLWAAATLLIVAGIVTGNMARRSRPGYAQALLADAYAKRRTLEIRMPGASYAPLSATRGPNDSNIDKPNTLLEAEALIGKELNTRTPDPRWLQEKARADLLDGNYESAISTAERAHALEPSSATLFGDLGSAYFARGEKSGSAGDYARSYEYFSSAISKTPDDPVFLFNRAIVSERESLKSQAIDDWKHYMRVETDREWLEEGRQRLEKLEKQLGDQEKREQGTLMQPDEFLTVAEASDGQSVPEIDDPIEKYQSLAVRDWLPRAFAEGSVDRRARESAWRSSLSLAGRLQLQHQDNWLSDVMSEAQPNSSGFSLLADAVTGNERGEYGRALQFARRAQAKFKQEGTVSGSLRAKLEETYAERFLANARSCHNDALALLSELHGLKYQWIRIQAELEGAACAAEVSNIGESNSLAHEARELARSSGYRSLELRSTVFLAGLSADPELALQYLREGLGEFWQGNFESMRGYSLYAVEDTTADTLHLWYYQAAVIREALRLVERDPDLGLRGMETHRLARAYVMVDDQSNAENAFRDARNLLAMSGSKDLETEISVNISEAYLQRGRYSTALELLQSVEPQLARRSDDILFGRFCLARATAFLGLGRHVDAERDLVATIQIAERGRRSILEARARFVWLESFRPAYKELAYLKFLDGIDSSFRWWEAFKGISARPTARDQHRSPQPEKIEQQPLPQLEALRSNKALLISYGVFSDEIVVWTYDGIQSKALLLPVPISEIETLTRRFAADCRDRSSSVEEISTLGREIYALVVQPLSGEISERRQLIIETDGFLSLIPFEALLDEHGSYLGELHAVSYSPGLFYASEQQKPFILNANSRALVVGDPLIESTTDFVGLPDAGDEAREVSAIFVNSRLLLREKATLLNVLKYLPDSEVFHFAGHSTVYQGMTRLMFSGAVDGGTEGVLALNGLNQRAFRNTRLAVLSACSTVATSQAGLDDRESLARNLIAAGVSEVVGSRWIVDSRASREWMGEFYRARIEGISGPDAARRASITVRNHQGWRHPFYWSPFTVFGFAS